MLTKSVLQRKCLYLKLATVCSTKHMFVNYCNKDYQATEVRSYVIESSYVYHSTLYNALDIKICPQLWLGFV